MVGGAAEAVFATRATPDALYRPHLDGIRALAVYLVVLYHVGFTSMSGGFIGVDVFFVLSGYLVTQLLLRDLAGEQKIRLRRFYARRYRRLLPAAFVTLMATAVAFTIVASAAEVASARGGFRAAFLYVANWYFLAQSADYFAAEVNTNPVAHFWSLAVEEQFYLIWPLLLGGVHLMTRRLARGSRWVLGVVVTAALVSVVAALRIAETDLARAYYGTGTRAYQLLAGAALALAPVVVRQLRQRATLSRVLSIAGLGALIVLGTNLIDITPTERGVGATVATVALIAAVEASPRRELVVRALGDARVVYLGRVSYGTYLWHWPLIVVLGYVVTLSTVALGAIVLPASTLLAALSFHVLEQPVRRSPMLDRRPLAVVAAGLGISIVAGVLLAPAVLDAKPSGPIEVDWQSASDDNPPLPDCGPEAIDQCTVVHGDGPHVVLVGDSNARMLLPAFTELARREGLTLSLAVQPLCPWARDVTYRLGVAECRATKAFWYDDLLPRLDPDVVVLAQRPIDDPASPVSIIAGDAVYDPGSAGFEEALTEQSRATIAELRSDGRQVVLVESVPIATEADDPLVCLSSARSLADCEYQANAEPTPLERAFRERADESDTWSIDLDRLICPRLPTCDPVVDDIVVKRDHNHITGTYSMHVAGELADVLHGAGVLP